MVASRRWGLAMNRVVVGLQFVLFLSLAVVVWAMPQGRFVLVMTDPAEGGSAMFDIIGRAGGAFVEQARFSWLAVAYSEDADFAQKLMSAGAVLVLNHNLATGCQRG